MKTHRADSPSVLVIDDNDVDREVMLELLAAHGYRASGMSSPIGAARELRRCNATCVIIDQNMPGMDGNKLVTLFRDNPATRNVRLVLVSGDDDGTMTRLARQVRADAFVSKGELHARLLPTLQGLLARAS